MSALIPGEQRQANLLDDEPLEDVEKFQYIGSIFVANGLLHLAFFQGSIQINEYLLPNLAVVGEKRSLALTTLTYN